MRQLALGQQRFGQAVIQTVQSKNDHPLERGGRRWPAAETASATAMRIGQVSSITTAENTAANTARNEPARAKPAPGPM